MTSLKGEALYGINSVLLALHGTHRPCHRILLQTSRKKPLSLRPDKQKLLRIQTIAKDRHIDIVR